MRVAAAEGEANRCLPAETSWWGESPALLETFKTVGKVAARNIPVLISGESGTGKELVARAIHAASPRTDGLLRGPERRRHPPRTARE